MAKEITPQQVQNIVILGFKRMEHFNKVQAMLVKSYVSHYYRETYGIEGSEPLNLVFNTVAAYIPTLIMKNPMTKVVTPYVEHKMTADLLGLALDADARQTRMKDELRAWATNALFGWGWMKVGIAAAGHMIQLGDVNIDPGQVYAVNIDIDDFGFDPTCKSIRTAKSMWHRTTVPRQYLLDTDGYDHDVVMNLPASRTSMTDSVSGLTIADEAMSAMVTMQDEVDVVEMHVPETNQLVTMGDPTQRIQNKYLRVEDFYGPKEGPYVPLSFTPPVPGNPFPVAPMSIWHDLAIETNRVFVKILDQIHSQKDIGLYSPAQVDTVDKIQDAHTGDWIPTMDPKGINQVSMGGQNNKNEAALAQLYAWYNHMSGNPDTLSGSVAPGSGQGKETATKTQATMANASIATEDMRDILYDQTAEVNRRKCWYFWTDPLINKPLTKRMIGGEQIQLYLTPEQRQGDFLDYVFRIVQRSMSHLDPVTRSKRIEAFCTNIIPGAANSALAMMQVGQPFNIPMYLTKIATEWDILEDVDEMFNDPAFVQKLAMYLSMGSKDTGQASTSASGAAQNKGNPQARTVQTPQQDFNQQAQNVAAVAQSNNQGGL